MAKVWTMGEFLCEIMRPEVGLPLDQPGSFLGPYPSGAPAIFIDTVARLGQSAGIIGGVGKDDFGKCMLERLEKDGVDCSLVNQYDDGSTGVAFVTYFSDGSRRFIFHFSDTPATRPTAPSIDKLGDDVQYFHIMGCSLMAKKEFGQEIIKVMRNLAKTGVMISFDPNIRPELMNDDSTIQMVQEVLMNCNVLLPGKDELLMICGVECVDDAVNTCFDNPALETIVLKNGAKGCTVYTRSDYFSLNAYPIEAVDSTGAGDCFDGAFLCGLLEGKSLRAAAEIASAAAAINTMAFGPMEGNITKTSVEEMITYHRLSSTAL